MLRQEFCRIDYTEFLPFWISYENGGVEYTKEAEGGQIINRGSHESAERTFCVLENIIILLHNEKQAMQSLNYEAR